jgi:hypothetical protein
LLQGIILAMKKKIQRLVILWDSSIIIQLMHKKISLVNYQLASILAQVQNEATKIQNLSFFHVLRIHNSQVDLLDNKAINL